MVFVNSQKFACESCIKGHRSSSCHHTDRPLFEVKKKGRPVSQCERCRELRQSRRVHSKCTCGPKEISVLPSQSQASTSGTKSRRFVPIIPALPNGLKDVLQSSRSSASVPPDVRQRVDSLLNPCNCRSVWDCQCRASSVSSQEGGIGLETLARAAAMYGNFEAPRLDHSANQYSPPTSHPSSISGVIASSWPKEIGKRITSRPGSPNPSTSKRHKSTSRQHSHIEDDLDLPPIMATSSSPLTAAPVFPTMPPMSEIASLADTSCCCGLTCACPGCVEHRGVDHASKHHKDCIEDACGSCIDNIGGIALPGTSNTTTNSVLDIFFARAAALPMPPPNRRMGVGVQLDPMNVTMYTSGRGVEERGMAFGMVSLPKLECCGGVCGCPHGRCGCGRSCDGCCEYHAEHAEWPVSTRAVSLSRSDETDNSGHAEGSVSTRNVSPRSTASETTPPLPSSPISPPAPRNCCAGNT